MIEIPRAADDFSRWGTYRPARYKVIRSDEKQTALMACPECGKVFSLRDHQIDPNGVVSPSVVCAANCGFHDFVRLLNWSG
jgi:predicted RNA-binding Zn-ribbon protein involved in translation (DUF1610 family)